jgi:hypothetical protein
MLSVLVHGTLGMAKSFSCVGLVLDYKLAVTVSIPVVIVKIATCYFKAASNECVVWTGLVSAQ